MNVLYEWVITHCVCVVCVVGRVGDVPEQEEVSRVRIE